MLSFKTGIRTESENLFCSKVHDVVFKKCQILMFIFAFYHFRTYVPDHKARDHLCNRHLSSRSTYLPVRGTLVHQLCTLYYYYLTKGWWQLLYFETRSCAALVQECKNLENKTTDKNGNIQRCKLDHLPVSFVTYIL